ncbi:MAG TPA: ABC-type transport auxiliary lipoprotein family protein [Aquella sp.]|nr:ABC-type transport auxiliary lipoprotein family protein [Aquella sp.]
MLKNIIKASLVVLFLSSCGMFLPVKTPEIHTYQLEAVKHKELQTQCPANDSNAILQVTYVRADAPYDTINMYYSDSPYKLDSYAVHQWVSLPSAMLTQAIQQKILLSCKYASVINIDFMTSAKYRLTNQVVNFKQIISKDSATFNMTVISHLVDNRTNQVIKSNTFDIELPVAPSPQGYIDGANQATSKFLDQLLVWLK